MEIVVNGTSTDTPKAVSGADPKEDCVEESRPELQRQVSDVREYLLDQVFRSSHRATYRPDFVFPHGPGPE